MNNRKEEGFDRAVGEAKRQASNVADAANTAARKRSVHLKRQCGSSSRISPILPWRLASRSAGYSAGYTDRSNL
jgi:hypothetical protein